MLTFISSLIVGSPTRSGPTMAGLKKLKLVVLTKRGTKKIPVEVNVSDNVGELRAKEAYQV